jgi:hypothetical protein
MMGERDGGNEIGGQNVPDVEDSQMFPTAGMMGEEEDLFRPSSDLSGRPSGSVGWRMVIMGFFFSSSCGSRRKYCFGVGLAAYFLFQNLFLIQFCSKLISTKSQTHNLSS